MGSPKLFQIGEMARLFHLSVSSIRHYEQLGLLKPEYTDPETGYRYYTPRQFEVFNTIRYLRALDMPLQEIADFLANADVILAKGQGNFETAYGSGWPIYYLFLCKCELFMRRFGKKKFGGMFVHESRVKDACLM